MNFWTQLPRPIVGLAPMDGVTDAAFRRVVAAQGAPDIMFTEFSHVSDLTRGPEYLLDSLVYSESERPIVAQIYGKDPDLFYQATHLVCELGFDGVDINMGCPSRNVASSGSGAALIKTPDLAHAIIRAVKQGIQDWAAGQSLESAGLKSSRSDMIRRMNAHRAGAAPIRRRMIPWSVKTRLGCDTVVITDWIHELAEERPAAITIHGRTLAQMYRGEADWTAIRAAVEAVRGSGTLILGNGDVRSLAEAARRVLESGVEGVLVGRATLGSPWFFRSKEAIRLQTPSAPIPGFTGSVAPEEAITLQERFAVMLDHARQFEDLWGLDQFRRMRKHLGWYCKGFPHAAAMRARMFHACSRRDVEAAMTEFLGAAFVSSLSEPACVSSGSA